MNELEMRQMMIEIVQKAGKGHLGTSLSSLRIITAIYEIMNATDIFISSKGHDALAQYMILAEQGILTYEQVASFRQPGGLPSHPTTDIPGIKANTGSLGMGLSKGLGFATVNPSGTVFVLLGDGEMMEGQNWEAALAVSNSQIKNIVAVVDCNGFSQDGPTHMYPGRIQAMFEAAGWDARIIWEHHDYVEMMQTLQFARAKGRMAVIIQTTKGKGASFEGTWQSHSGPPRDDYSIKHPLYKAFGEVVEKAMEKDPSIVLCGADTLRDHNCYNLKDRFPDRVFDFGIAEQNIISFASALALEGKKPIVMTYAAFLRRGYEQIYNQTTEGTKVIYIGSMAGPLSEGGPGISHQSLDDGDYMETMMNVQEINPKFPELVKECLGKALKSEKSEYIRLIHE